MSTRLRAGLAATALLLATLVFAIGTRSAFAAEGQPPGPDRYAVLVQSYTSYTWWLIGWSDNKIACTLEIDHDGLPNSGEIYDLCGETLYEEWLESKPCQQSESEPGACEGYYLHLYKSEPAQRDVGVMLPPPVVWVTLQGCIPYNSTFRCDRFPTLVLTGEEPLTGERVTGLAGRIDGKDFTCAPVCQVELAPTDSTGLVLEFWATSSYGDTSELFQARVRVAAPDDPADHSWYVDILSRQWLGAPLAACSQTWGAFPPVGGNPAWLASPARPEYLKTNIPYSYLAGRLIEHGVVDASACEDRGLLENGFASGCGMDAARLAVGDWQNRFDELIFSAAQETGVPAQLLKNIFSRESQFWPGVTSGKPEVGLGQMTENGADTLMLWNRPFFEQFCPSVLADSTCRLGYPHLEVEQQEMLQAVLVRSVDAFCPNCPLGIDLERADRSVGIFAETLLANCEQAGMIVYNTYGISPGEAATYEDLWRFTLVNYNAGPGCLTLAILETSSQGEPLDWEHLSSHLTPACQGALDYVTAVSGTP